MGKQVVIYCYRMTHDYGINPCAFTEDYERTPELLTLGGCLSDMRESIYKRWKNDKEDKEDIYVMAIAGHPNDRCDANGKCSCKDEHGREYISPEYEHLVYVAKISKVIPMKEYLERELSKGRRDTVEYNRCPNEESDNTEKVLLSRRFSYYGKTPQEICCEVLKLFPKRNFKINIWENLTEKQHEALCKIEKDSIAGENHIDCPYYPIFVLTCDCRKDSCGK